MRLIANLKPSLALPFPKINLDTTLFILLALMAQSPYTILDKVNLQ